MTATQQNVKALYILLSRPVTVAMISHLAAVVSGMVECNPALAPSLPPPYHCAAKPNLPSLEDFISHLGAQPRITTPVLMSTLVYLARFKRRIGLCKGSPSTCHRLFLALLILSVKYNDDTPYKNKSWAELSDMSTQKRRFRFDCNEINMMERQALELIDWNLSVSEKDLLRELEPFLAPIREQLLRWLPRSEEGDWTEACRATGDSNGIMPAASHRPMHPRNNMTRI